jgi:hypothetical protein
LEKSLSWNSRQACQRFGVEFTSGGFSVCNLLNKAFLCLTIIIQILQVYKVLGISVPFIIIIIIIIIIAGRNSVVGIATRYGLEDPGIESG